MLCVRKSSIVAAFAVYAAVAAVVVVAVAVAVADAFVIAPRIATAPSLSSSSSSSSSLSLSVPPWEYLALFGHRTTLSAAAGSSFSTSASGGDKKTLVVVSPPGGIGEASAVAAAKSGHSVRWFVVSSPSLSLSSSSSTTTTTTTTTVRLSSSVLSAIQSAGGSIELAGADASSLLLPPSTTLDGPSDAAGAVGRWCSSNGDGFDGLIVTVDGASPPKQQQQQQQQQDGPGGKKAAMTMSKEEQHATADWADAIKVAAREAAKAGKASRMVAVVPAPFTENYGGSGDDDANATGDAGVGAILGSLLGGKKGRRVDVPASLSEALGSAATTLRYGELFGLPESSPDASPFVGGPRRDPILREEYNYRSVRIDPTVSATGAAMMGTTARSSRLSIGEAACLLALSSSSPESSDNGPLLPVGSDICLTSLRGSTPLTYEDWSDEFSSVSEALLSKTGAGTTGKGKGGAQLFAVSFGSVPDVDRLADWIATKWAPAVLRTYDIAGIRVGARPVYAARVADRIDNGDSETVGTSKMAVVEIVWQKLVNFESVTVGTMIIDVNGKGIVASRGPGDAKSGFGQISLAPLPGEDVLVRRLADAASQAVEKGLAKKAAKSEKKKNPTADSPAPVPTATATATMTTLAASGSVVDPKKEDESSIAAVGGGGSSPLSDAGPRSAGVRRSSERTRGTRRRRTTKPNGGNGDGDGAGKEGPPTGNSPEAFQ